MPAARPASRSCVFAHIPLWLVYKDWGWGTDDGEQALSLLRRFGSVTVLNGHIHQVHAEGRGHGRLPHRPLDRIPAARAGQRAKPGADEDRAGKLRSVLGTAEVRVVAGTAPLAIVDTPLAG